MKYFKSESKRAEIRAEAERPQTDRIMDDLFLKIMLGDYDIIKTLLHRFELLNVSCTKRELERLTQLLMETSNNTNMWHNFVWTPTELGMEMGNQKPKSVVLGSGY